MQYYSVLYIFSVCKLYMYIYRVGVEASACMHFKLSCSFNCTSCVSCTCTCMHAHHDKAGFTYVRMGNCQLDQLESKAS